MKQITVISGKGGTGKTILTASFASLAKSKIMVDCDVDAADLYLLLNPVKSERYEFWSGKTARIDPASCNACHLCIDLCRFDAIRENFVVDPVSCEGCGFCSRICPVDAITMREKLSGEYYISETRFGPFVHAKLGIAEGNSGKLVTKIRQTAKDIAEQEGCHLIIIDGPPGIGCPVMASLTDTDLVVIVTEPSLSGIHDMMRLAEVIGHFQIPIGVIINKCDLNPEHSLLIEEKCRAVDMDVIGRIPFSTQAPHSLVQRVPLVEFTQDEITTKIIAAWNKIEVMVSDLKKR